MLPTATALLLAIAAPPSQANDTAMGGSGAGVYPVESTAVRLVRELVIFQQLSDSFVVSADLHFRNETSKPVTLQLGFPARTKVEGDGDPEVHDLAIHIDGEPVTAHKVALSQEESVELPWEEIWLFEARFPAQAEVQILHTYTLTTGADSMGGQLTQYIFQTGKGWAGTIDQARFLFRFERPPAGLEMFYAGQRLPPLGAAPSPGQPTQSYVAGPTPTYELVFEGVEPTGDLWLYWGGQPWHGAAAAAVGPDRLYDCLYPLKSWYDGLRGPGWAGSPLPDQELLGCYGADWLRNLIFASRAYPFTKPRWQAAFDGLFPPSDLPWEDGWLNEKERLAVEALKGI
jgi:hypothetical protein